MTAQAPLFWASPGLADWLGERRVAIAFTTYRANKLFLTALTPGGALSLVERDFERCMGLGPAPGGGFWMAGLYQLWRFGDFLDPGERRGGRDAVYVPLTAHTTGQIDAHDVRVGPSGRPIFAATRFNCLATLSRDGSFAPLWRPPFIDAYAPEDRCHLNGLALDGDAPAFVTCLGLSNEPDGWRPGRRDGGAVLRVGDGEAVIGGLSMPHSPRLQGGLLWFLDSGSGALCRADPRSGRRETVCLLDGFARGLALREGFAVVGLSRPRGGDLFEGLSLGERLGRTGAAPSCGLAVVDLERGIVAHRLEMRAPVEELYDVAVLEGAVRPALVGVKSDEIRYLIRLG